MIQPEHLGDGAYAQQEFDGVTLTANGIGMNATDTIHLDRYGWLALCRFMAEVEADQKRANRENYHE
jgi:hypothetical protein